MSDTSQAPGWWSASDGRWYPPPQPHSTPPPVPSPQPPTLVPPDAVPSRAAQAKRPIYKRTWVIVTAAIVVVVGASVLIDLPQPISNAQDIASQTASMKEINMDLTPCSYAVNETFLIHHDQVTGALSTTDRESAAKMLVDDQTACSFTGSSVFDLTNNIQVSDTAAGKYVDRMLSTAVIWTTSDALAAVEDIQVLYSDPTNAAKLADLAKQERLLRDDRNQAIADILSADSILHAQLAQPNLPALPQV